MQPGPSNLITDVPGLIVGNATDQRRKTGCTVLLGSAPFVAGYHVMGGAPGTRETDLLAPDKSVEQVDALVLSGGSAFGLDAGSGVADGLAAMGRGFAVGAGDRLVRVPIVPAAILFDLLNGGDKDWLAQGTADSQHHSARRPDHALPDTGLPDTGLPDTGLPDTGLPDTGHTDTPPADALAPDIVPTDTGPTDIVPIDTVPTDTTAHASPSAPPGIRAQATGRPEHIHRPWHHGPGDNPYKSLGRRALAAAAPDFALGSEGAGTGATTATLKGGLGSASVVLPGGIVVGALVAVNALGSATVGDGDWFWAAPFEVAGEFGGRGVATAYPTGRPATKGHGGNTTIAIIATNAALTKAQCTRLATAAHDGIGRALVPSHTAMDGDLIFAASTGEVPCDDLIWLGHAAATCLARAIARGVYLATPAPGDLVPTWGQLWSTPRPDG